MIGDSSAFCITVDFDTLNDKAVTIRSRDSTEQERRPIDAVAARQGELTAAGRSVG